MLLPVSRIVYGFWSVRNKDLLNGQDFPKIRPKMMVSALKSIQNHCNSHSFCFQKCYSQRKIEILIILSGNSKTARVGLSFGNHNFPSEIWWNLWSKNEGGDPPPCSKVSQGDPPPAARFHTPLFLSISMVLVQCHVHVHVHVMYMYRYIYFVRIYFSDPKSRI